MTDSSVPTHVTEFHFLVGYQASWTKKHPLAVVNRLKVGLRDKVRAIFPQELMDRWEAPPSVTQHDEHPLDPGQHAFRAALRALPHAEHETEACLNFAQSMLDEVNATEGRQLMAETNGTGGAAQLEGCLYIDHAWYKIESFALYEKGAPVEVEAFDALSNTRVLIPLVATVMYECMIP